MKLRCSSRKHVPRLLGIVLAAVVLLASSYFHCLSSPAFAQEPSVEEVLDRLYGLENLRRINDEDDQWWVNRDGNTTARAKFAAFFQTFGFIDATQEFRELFTETGDGFDVSGFGTLPTQDNLSLFRWGLNEWSSYPGDNADQVDHMFTWLITDGPSAGNLVIAWEDLPGSGGDYQDLVVEVSHVTPASEVAEVITFEGLEAGAHITGVFGSRGSGPIGVQGTNPLLSRSTNAAMIFDSACPPVGMPGDCTGEDMDLGTPNEAFGGPGVGRGGASSNNTALGKVLVIAENIDDVNRDRLVDDPDDASRGGTLHLDFSALGSVIMHAITFVDLDDPDPAQQVELFHGGVTGTLLTTVPLPVAGDNGVSVVPLNVPGVDTVVITLSDSAAIDNIIFTPESEASDRLRSAERR